jgi:hypothetical protein
MSRTVNRRATTKRASGRDKMRALSGSLSAFAEVEGEDLLARDDVVEVATRLDVEVELFGVGTGLDDL